MLTVELSHVANPDYADVGGYASGAPSATASDTVACASFEECADRAQDFIATHDLGAGNWTGGKVRDARGLTVAHIAYNGRIVAMPDREHDLTPGFFSVAEFEAFHATGART